MKYRVNKTAMIAGLAICLTGVAGLVQAADEPANVIKYRKSLMTANTSHMGAMGEFAKGTVTFKGGFVEFATAINAISMQIPALFPAGSNTGAETRAKPEIWSKRDDFVAAAKKLETESAKLIVAAKGTDENALKAQITATQQACGGCHETFRSR